MNIVYNKLELLAPAGSYECAKAAVNAGADAIYMGGARYGARAFAKSTSEDSIMDSIKLVKENGKKFYLTVNTLFKQKELREIFLYLDPIVKTGIDAFIVQDLGVSMLLKENYKDVELHASTQMTIASSKAINLVKRLGFSQVVLSRELSIKEIKKIKKEVGDDIKLEAFIHGSMCYSYSGACLMSSFIGGESGNRGRCKGPCRLPYFVDKNKGLKMGNTDLKARISMKSHAPYILSMKDMCAINSLSELVDAGISSFKIEGRMRQADYVYGTTKIYRKYLDMICRGDNSEIDQQCRGEYCEPDIKKDENYLLQLYNKGGFTNYYNKHNGADMIQRYERK